MIIKFHSKTCGPCKVLSRILDKHSIQHVSLDIKDEHSQELIDKYNIISIPTLLKVDDDGNIIDKLKDIKESTVIEFCNEK
jgi:glutaredoxin